MAVLGKKGKKLDLLIKQGSTFGPYPITLRNPDGTAVNTAELIISGTIRKTPKTPVVVTIEFEKIDNSGRYNMIIPASQTTLLTAGQNELSSDSKYVWDCELINSNLNIIIPLFYGEVRVFRNI